MQLQILFRRIAGQGDEDRGRGAEVGHAFGFHQAVDGFRLHLAQADLSRPHGHGGPGKTPAVAMKQGKGPKINGPVVYAEFDDFPQGVEIGPPVVVHDALRKSGGAGGIVQGRDVMFIRHRTGNRIFGRGA